MDKELIFSLRFYTRRKNMKLKFKYEYDIDAKFYVILEFMLTTLDQLQKNNVLKMTKLPFFYERRINISK